KDTERAHRLADDLISKFGVGRSQPVTDVESGLSRAAGLVNATPVGMLGIPGIPVPLGVVASRLWVADVIYTPLETDLVKGARDLPALHGTRSRHSSHATRVCRGGRSQRQEARRLKSH